MTSSIRECRAAVGKRVRFEGTRGDEYDKKQFGKPVEGTGKCVECHAGHGLYIVVEPDDKDMVDNPNQEFPECDGTLAVDMGEVEILPDLPTPITTEPTSRCRYAGCQAPATCIAAGRARYQGVACYCEAHADAVVAEGAPEYACTCPNCGCLFGMN